MPSTLSERPKMPVHPPDSAGVAALAICEALLLSLLDRKILPEAEILGILEDAAAAHTAHPDDGDAELHRAAARLIAGIRIGQIMPRRR
ncbi:hypothetical protein EBL87_13235 [Cereibacter sphaeroides]|uniref:hypothetical protein n=1 Tax=Cereibacter sphaeroides TaxID=1063 RepID=UPI0000F29D90|nr:hypothetical protein [Cereibacter sphaeroides]ABN75721.1 hypothetical protein Rsph17029_0605 [Cereibacter sphaeroides ATCC 17029]AZB64655.1 hypothetical protein EBL87_13235 [Cereibacter sphaeroides]AZB67410.1 hypothetical protein EBL86_02940 [Cereibacter sphaeroides]MWP37635.1 hypothetical protein [Cereibacter sphaeroides]